MDRSGHDPRRPGNWRKRGDRSLGGRRSGARGRRGVPQPFPARVHGATLPEMEQLPPQLAELPTEAVDLAQAPLGLAQPGAGREEEDERDDQPHERQEDGATHPSRPLLRLRPAGSVLSGSMA